MQTETERLERHNSAINAQLREQIAERGWLACGIGRGHSVHAARSLMDGHGGFKHPRALCQPASPSFYAHPLSAPRELTCQRCISSLGKLELELARKGRSLTGEAPLAQPVEPGSDRVGSLEEGLALASELHAAQALAATLGMLERNEERALEQAEAALDKARSELREIEEQLRLAKDGAPYRRIGMIYGLDAGAIFAAFGALESLAAARQIAARAEG